MRIICLLPLLLILAGCGDKQPGTDSTNSTAGSPITAPVDYLGAVGKAQQTAVKTIDLTSVQQAIQLFHTEEGRFPATLDELVAEKFLPRLPQLPVGFQYSYEAANGSVKAVRK